MWMRGGVCQMSGFGVLGQYLIKWPNPEPPSRILSHVTRTCQLSSNFQSNYSVWSKTSILTTLIILLSPWLAESEAVPPWGKWPLLKVSQSFWGTLPQHYFLPSLADNGIFDFRWVSSCKTCRTSTDDSEQTSGDIRCGIVSFWVSQSPSWKWIILTSSFQSRVGPGLLTLFRGGFPKSLTCFSVVLVREETLVAQSSIIHRIFTYNWKFLSFNY